VGVTMRDEDLTPLDETGFVIGLGVRGRRTGI